MKTFEQYHKANDFLEGLFNLRDVTKQYGRARNPEIYLKRMRYFLKLLGNPEKGMKYIHITGTAGKGSVANLIHKILIEKGERAGLFTSPFVTSAIEKIKVGDKYIDPDDFAKIVEEIKPAINQAFRDNLGPSYFELFVAIALMHFKKQKCRWVVLEVGAGGKYDATNIIEKPKVAVITNVDYDHMHLLGNTLVKIATDKAGIIKKGCVFWTAESRPHILKIFQKICRDNRVAFNRIDNKNFRNHQEQNQELARRVTREINIPEKIIEKGINKTKPLPCRFEIIQKQPIVILDGAHNRVKIRSTLNNLQKFTFNRLFLIISFAENKNPKDVLEPIIPYIDYLFATRYQMKERACADPNQIIVLAKKIKKNLKVDLNMDPNQALAKALKMAKKNDLILVTGSFFLAGELRKRWFSEEYILRNRKSY